MQRDIMVKLTSTAGRNRFPLWTPDGRHIIYDSTGHQAAGMYCIRADGSTPAVRITDSAGIQAPFAFVPDGKGMVFGSRDDAARWHTWLLPLDWSDPDAPRAGKPEPFPPTAAALDAAFSP